MFYICLEMPNNDNFDFMQLNLSICYHG